MGTLWIDLAAILAGSAPLIFATMGETISERVGVVNLSLDGTMLLSAMVGFAVGLESGSVIIGLFAAAMVGALIALILCILSLSLKQSQTAVGFVLTLLGASLSSFLGNPYVRVQGIAVPYTPVPILSDIPILGTLFFSHSPLVYASFVLIIVVWWFLFHTHAGLILRALGERPAAAFARGINVTARRYFYVILSGALVGLAGAAYSLDAKQGWSHGHIAGSGWIALAIVIFGGWTPWRVALGCYLLGALQIFAIRSQAFFPQLPTQIFLVAPFVLMIGILVLVNMVSNPTFARLTADLPDPLRRVVHALIDRLAVAAPAALGKPDRW